MNLKQAIKEGKLEEFAAGNEYDDGSNETQTPPDISEGV
jgi:hypothetical protein